MESKRHNSRAVKNKKSKDKKYYMYVVQCGDHTESYYCGISTDPDRRLKEHNESKRGAKYTRSRRPVRLVFTQECESKSDALKKEAAFKKLTRSQKLKYMCDYIEEQVALQVANSPQVKEVKNGDANIETDCKPRN